MIVYVDASCGAVIHDHIGELYCSLLRLISVFAQHWAILLGLKIYVGTKFTLVCELKIKLSPFIGY
jgi:hypothetical protein